MSKRKKSLIYTSVLEHIRSELLKGNLKAGSRLPTVVKLAQNLNIGVPSVREAYRVLETKGILEVTQGKGTFVSSHFDGSNSVLRQFQLVEQESPLHLLQARKLLEPGIAALAAEMATEFEIKTILEDAERQEALDPYKIAHFDSINIRFHDLIVSVAKNPIVTQIITLIYDMMRDVEPIFEHFPESVEKSIYFHKLIALAIRSKNPEAARALMNQHLETAEKLLVSYLSAGRDGK
jgi:GntR family transcriptional repressor for pyruvate dehydrogenase complex